MRLFLNFSAYIAVSLLYVSSVFAQYSITPIPPPANFTFNDLWHFNILKASEDKYSTFYVALRVFDGNSQLKVKSNTATFTVLSGTHYYNQTNLSQLQPLNTSFYDAGMIQHAISSGGYFPPGIYNIVYTLMGKASDGDYVPLAEEAVLVSVEVMWPPLLIWPENESIIGDPFPILTWTPAYSSTYGGQITYDLKMVELLPGQSPEASILSNPVFYRLDGTLNTFHPYSAADPALTFGQTYVWQVTASLGTSQAQSQIWRFTYGAPVERYSIMSVEPEYLYAPLKTKLDGSYIETGIFSPVLRIKYTEEYDVPENSFLVYNVYDKNGIKIKSSLPPFSTPSSLIKKGDNYITLVSGSGGMNLSNATDFYTLEVLNHKNEKWYLRFKYNGRVREPFPW